MAKSDSSVKIHVRGLPQLRAAFRKVDNNLTIELKNEMIGIASKVATRAKSKMPVRSGRARGSVKARGSFGGAKIAAYGQAAPYGHFLDFGGTTGRGHKLGRGRGSIIRKWMGKPVGSGRYVYVAIGEMHKQIIRDTDALLEKLIKSAGFEVRGKNG